jgi:hypothetical protein
MRLAESPGKDFHPLPPVPSPPMPGFACASPYCSPRSAGSACGRWWSCCPRSRLNSRSTARQRRLDRSSPTHHFGSPAVAASQSRSPHRATIWRAPSGRPTFSTSSRPSAGGRPNIGIGVLCAITMIPLAHALRRRPLSPRDDRQAHATLGLSPTDSADCRPCCSAPRHRCWHYCSISASAAWRRYM